MLRDFESERQRLFTRRAVLLGLFQSSLFGVLAARMYYLQVLESDKYATLAEENRINLQLLAPSRGLIFDRNGTKLSINEQNFRLVLVPEQVGRRPKDDVPMLLQKLRSFLPVTEEDEKRLLRDMKRARAFAPITVVENLSWEQTATLETRLPELPGLSISVGEIRHYPFGPSSAHILGYVGAVSEKDLKNDADPVLTLPGFQIGKTGIERQYDDEMRGVAGSADLEVNAFGRTIREIARRPGQPGKDVRLTIDQNLQTYVQQRLMTERSAACVVMDVHTGAIYSFASHPSFDPNVFSQGIPHSLWQDLNSDETTPLINKVVAGQYAPGSTFKCVVAAAALESGQVGVGHTVPCYGAIDMGSHRFHCWKRGGHGTMDMVGALRESCDVYFYDVARKIGIDPIAEMARKLGMGVPTGIDLPSESAGLVPDRAWKQKRYKETWLPGETLIVSIGQGAMLSTPLQLAVMTARLVNGGKAVVPHLLQDVGGQSRTPAQWPDLGLSKETLAVVQAGMESVCNDRRGTAFGARIAQKGQEMGGKTGTSQVRRITMAERAAGIVANEHRPWRLRDHALFVGYAPAHAPRYAVAVIVEHGGGGSRAAAPIARDVLMEAQKLNLIDDGPLPAATSPQASLPQDMQAAQPSTQPTPPQPPTRR